MLFWCLQFRFWTDLNMCPRFFFCQISLQKNCLYVYEKLQRNPKKGLRNVYFSTLFIWQFGIFEKRPQGCDEVKNSIGLLQGPRLMVWTTKSPIWGNRWVPLSCRALLGSVNSLSLLDLSYSLIMNFSSHFKDLT